MLGTKIAVVAYLVILLAVTVVQVRIWMRREEPGVRHLALVGCVAMAVLAAVMGLPLRFHLTPVILSVSLAADPVARFLDAKLVR